MTPSEITALLRAPVQPAHGAWQIYANVQNALATLIEQNERIIELLGPSDSARAFVAAPLEKK
jgi:hypothetical protein